MTSHRARALMPPVAAALAALVPLGQAGTASAAVIGPDVSGYQHPYGVTIDWNGVHASGAAFAFVKATEGMGYTNAWFARDWAALAASGTIRGAYHFAQPSATPGSAQAQARHFVAVAGTMSRGGDLAPVLDLEISGGLSHPALAAWTRAYLTTVAALTHRTPILYTYPSFWASAMGGDRSFSAYPLWIARYSSQQPAPVGGWAHWTFWQYTDAGTVRGMPTKVDVSTFNGTLDQLRAMARLAPASRPVSQPTSTPPGPVPTGGWSSLSAVPGGARITAWGADPAVARRAVSMRVFLDGRVLATRTAGVYRSDVARVHPAYGASHGLDMVVSGIAPGNRQLCLTVVGTTGRQKSLGCRTWAQKGDPKIQPSVTRSAGRIWVSGWAIDPQTSRPVTVQMSINGKHVSSFVANRVTPVPTGVWGAWGRGHGYVTSYPVSGKVKVCLTYVNQSYGTTRTACWSR